MIQYKTLVGRIGIVSYALAFCFTCSCDPDNPPSLGGSGQFETIPEKFPVQAGIIDEASGLVPSSNIAGHLWTHQDSDQPNALYLLTTEGRFVKEYPLPGTRNRDWEDIASGPGPQEGVNYLYIGDIGNNNQPASEFLTIYRVAEISEPGAAFDAQKVDRIVFRYPDGNKDAESLLMDPVTKDIFVVSKETQTAVLYRLPYPQSTSETMTAEKVGTVPSVSIATGGSVSRDGSEILMRTYLSVYYWKRKEGETIGQTLTKSAAGQLFVAPEPQGEAICFDRESKGFYTLSEKSSSTAVTLNYYKRK